MEEDGVPATRNFPHIARPAFFRTGKKATWPKFTSTCVFFRNNHAEGRIHNISLLHVMGKAISITFDDIPAAAEYFLRFRGNNGNPFRLSLFKKQDIIFRSKSLFRQGNEFSQHGFTSGKTILFLAQNPGSLPEQAQIRAGVAGFPVASYFPKRAAGFPKQGNEIKIKVLLYAVMAVSVGRNMFRLEYALSIIMEKRLFRRMAQARKFPGFQKSFHFYPSSLDPRVTPYFIVLHSA